MPFSEQIKLNSYIDHTLLKAESTEEQIIALTE
jgi:deoxyribose-phosphate aldolase